ncbi:MAG: DUF742 domain-containing protein [Micromonosporaceae bacterium]|nr:DUF742 domain-containing protein [Micromonosporaceae bacterium]
MSDAGGSVRDGAGAAVVEEIWVDEAAGPVVRPYTMTGGRTRPAVEGFDLVAFVLTVEPLPRPDPRLHPEHFAALEVCRAPLSVAEVASQLDLPLGVVRVLLGDLLDMHLVMVREPASTARLPDEDLLETVLHGLQAL